MRAFSLLLVFLFHLQISLFSFGYIGVDIFFIISGFLMPIILHKYTPKTYIKARVKRLYPALSFLVFIALIIGFFILMPGEYKSLAESSLSALLFSSNYYFFFNTGYFDIESQLQLLLHTWTLGNEFLGYLLIFLSWLLFGKKNLLYAAYALCFLSLIYIITRDSDLQYLDFIPRLYLFFSAFIVSTKFRKSDINQGFLYLISLISLSILIYFFGTVINEQIWPNKAIIILPAFIIPLLMMKRSLVPSFVEPTFMKIGDWSYSIYLWHWIIIAAEFVFLRNAVVGGYKEALILFIPGFALGVFSYYFIERNIKLSFITTGISIVMAGYILYSNGVESRVDAKVTQYADIHLMQGVDYVGKIKDSGLSYSIVQFSESNTSSTLVVGDSFSQHILPILKEREDYKKDNIYKLAIQPDGLVHNWEQINSFIKDYGVDELFISYRLNTKNNEDIKKLSELLNNAEGYRITVIRDNPSVDSDPVACYIKKYSILAFQGCGYDIEKGIPLSKVTNINNNNWIYLNEYKINYEVVNTHEGLCNKSLCTTVINNEFIMRDGAHFNEKLSKETNLILGDLLFSK